MCVRVWVRMYVRVWSEDVCEGEGGVRMYVRVWSKDVCEGVE